MRSFLLVVSVTLSGLLGPVAALATEPALGVGSGASSEPGVGMSNALGVDERPQGVWPLSPRPAVAARFAPPETRWGAGHRGVDLVGHPVATVRSALPGRVRFAGRIAGRGVLVVGHGSTRTTYEPVVAVVHVGDPVAAGQPIGRLEVAGSHCFPAACLHWGWLRGETYLDPLDLVGAQPVRLLPPSGRTAVAGPRMAGPPSHADRARTTLRVGARAGALTGGAAGPAG